MTKKDFFRLIIKIFGLYLLISILFSVLPSNILFVVNQIDLVGIVWLIGSIVVTVLLFLFLIFQSDKIISWLKLDKGFDDEKIDFHNFNNSNILKLALIIIGGIILIQNIPAFLSNIFFAFKSSIAIDLNGDVIKNDNMKGNIKLATTILNIIIGYLLLTNYDYIVNILKSKVKDD